MATKKKVIQGGLDVQQSDGTSALVVDETTGAATAGPSGFSGTHLIYGSFGFGTTNTDMTLNRVNGLRINPTTILSRGVAAWNFGYAGTSGTHIIFFTDNGTSRVTAGSISSNGTTTSFNGTSDERLKEALGDWSGLDICSQIKARKFKWKDDQREDFGYFAQELFNVYPNAVKVGDDEIENNRLKNPWGVDYGRITPVLVKAIQELSAQVETLKAEVAALKGQ